jgi:hypothetical protein
MRRLSDRSVVGRVFAFVVAIPLVGSADRGFAIEMFTFFGDGSRIGLPSLEVPVEAYPGIPLRSDRIRMQRGPLAAGSPAAGRPADSRAATTG